MSQNAGGGGNVPSFKSFKPRTRKPFNSRPEPGGSSSNPQANPEQDVSQISAAAQTSNSKSQRKRHRKPDHGPSATTTPNSLPDRPPPRISKPKKKKKKKPNQTPALPIPSPRPGSTSQPIQPPPPSSSEHLFIFDTRGDPQNVTYGGPDKYTIPNYRRSGLGYVVGAPGMRIDRNASTERVLVLLRDGSASGVKEGGKEGGKVLSSRKGKVGRGSVSEGLEIEHEKEADDGERDFVGLEKERKRGQDVGERKLRPAGGIWDAIDPRDDPIEDDKWSSR